MADIKSVAGDLDLILSGVTDAVAAYKILHGIWSTAHPDKTEDDFRAALRGSAQINIDETAAQLTADGWTETTPGNWTPPAK